VSGYQRVRREAEITDCGGVRLCRVPALVAAGCDHGFTLRCGGVSEAPFDSLNLGHNRPDDPQKVAENYRRFAAAAGFPLETAAIVSYCHGNGVERLTAAERGYGFPGAPRFPDCDGFITDDPEVTAVTLHADCMAVFLYDPVKKAGGMLHAGWKGTSLRIGRLAAEKMIAELDCSPQNILAGIGPSICADCFEVDEPVMRIFADAFPDVEAITYRKATGKYHIDLWHIMCAQLMEAGIQPENITVTAQCTCCGEGYFSFRRDGKLYGSTGAMAGYLRV